VGMFMDISPICTSKYSSMDRQSKMSDSCLILCLNWNQLIRLPSKLTNPFYIEEKFKRNLIFMDIILNASHS